MRFYCLLCHPNIRLQFYPSFCLSTIGAAKSPLKACSWVINLLNFRNFITKSSCSHFQEYCPYRSAKWIVIYLYVKKKGLSVPETKSRLLRPRASKLWDLVEGLESHFWHTKMYFSFFYNKTQHLVYRHFNVNVSVFVCKLELGEPPKVVEKLKKFL